MKKHFVALSFASSFFSVFTFILLIDSNAIGQVPAPDFDVYAMIGVATGQTSGHIADLTITNKSNVTTTSPSGPMMIPSGGQYQPYITSIDPTPIGPGETKTIPVIGFCTDIYLPPVPSGDKMPPFVNLSPKEMIMTEQLNRIIVVTDSLLTNDVITTPFSGNPQQEREAVIQQTFWIYTSSLSGKPYGYFELCENIHDQLRPVNGTPSTIDENALKVGITDFWNAIIEVGKAADVPSFIPTPLPTEILTPTMATPVFPEVVNKIKVTGTGNTTGHIANLNVSNTTDKPITVFFGPGAEPFDGKPLPPGQTLSPGPGFFIPSSGGYQPYIVPSLGPVTLGPGETRVVPVDGFCVDIHTPPVPNGTEMPSFTEWITPPAGTMPTLTPDEVSGSNQTIDENAIAVIPSRLSLPLDQAVETILNSRPDVMKGIPYYPSESTTLTPKEERCIPFAVFEQPTIPGTTTPVNINIDPNQIPSVGVPVLLDALKRIEFAYDDLKDKGSPVITTPFSGNPEKEREAVIQQTFWRYTSELTGNKYGKENFKGQAIRQFENSSGKPFSTTPQSQQDKINEGVDDFWNTFEAVGVEAKILSVPVPLPAVPVPTVNNVWKNYTTKEAKVL